MNDFCNGTEEILSSAVVQSDVESISLCETLDRVLNKGVVIGGEVVISVADIDLVYLGVKAVLTSVETARRMQIGSV
jgi:gas vesicle structural protein